MTVEQYKALLDAIPQINANLKEQGIDIATNAIDEDEDAEDNKLKKRVKAKKESKSNIEATSDEEEEE